MHIHILGICGTFMGSLAVLAKQLGHHVTGSDQAVYPPMSTQLEAQGIELMNGYSPDNLDPAPDLVVIGNAMSRGNAEVEAVLDRGLPYTSGPEWLARYVLQGRWTLAVSGTHGKTTTSTMLAWILEYAGMSPGFLIGGVPQNFEASARLGDTPFFVVEADEYDSAFFDKRSKFVHYRPRTLIMNNLEFDHADIFSDLAAIQTQFHHLIRTVPSTGLVIAPKSVESINQVLDKGCWSDVQTISTEQGDWTYQLTSADGSIFSVEIDNESATVNWTMTGLHNVLNGVAAMAAARHVGVTAKVAAEALSQFGGVKRRLELLADIDVISGIDSIKVYDDFAHHPTAIETTLDGLRKQVGDDEIIILVEPRSNTMKMGVHQNTLLASAEKSDQVIWANLASDGSMNWLGDMVFAAGGKHQLGTSVDGIINTVKQQLKNNPTGKKHIVMMSNGGFSGIHQALISALQEGL
ncbi:UDP-N-acetylmuramate:L-alanyl-gamma-D-glutamyl-meso-diaminopimelate ligase [Alkalimarinus alittae]|uniref:UDP-N-acetylmuramate--L-alanyl-gamma-D-glutamyl-meso-2,6-diaminoheptandioate ligase n=1 Tax=Alkalimarinus alittae TaxID=2961619 RepID=A0ABY6N4X1_9ALTE|nr:UDP-N-acetylmuramate:L-alanyl-gamma-D-glutamyl-meso-diaminopimelate ligase [Alkalimarinus alittae]UZE97042.1 UDP-N-acetylmuramate:L-alanyl-gamma-D-glutamyl-meso-diaminopimelate ligase [Alkalimarinus alittae]